MWQSLGRNLKGLLTAICLLAFALCAVEIVLRINRFQCALDGQPAAVTADLPLEDQLLAPSVDIWAELLPNAKAILKSPDTGELVEFKTNSFGARGRDPVVPKPDGVIRVLCLGDETTLAPELSEAEAYPAQLQEFLSKTLSPSIEVVNAGIPGSCPRLAVLQLKHRLMALQPDLVILHFDMSDVAEDAAVRRFVALDRAGMPTLATHPATRKACQLKRPRLSDEFLVVQQAELQLARWWDRELPPTGETVVDRRQRYRWTEDNPPEMEDEIQSAMAPLESMRKLCDLMGAKLLVSTTPKPWQISPLASPTREARAINGIKKETCWKTTEPFKRLVAACQTAEIAYVIPLSSFLQTPKPERLFLRKSPGLSALGHALYAQVLADVISGSQPQETIREPEIIPSHAETPAWHDSHPN